MVKWMAFALLILMSTFMWSSCSVLNRSNELSVLRLAAVAVVKSLLICLKHFSSCVVVDVLCMFLWQCLIMRLLICEQFNAPSLRIKIQTAIECVVLPFFS